MANGIDRLVAAARIHLGLTAARHGADATHENAQKVLLELQHRLQEMERASSPEARDALNSLFGTVFGGPVIGTSIGQPIGGPGDDRLIETPVTETKLGDPDDD